MNKRNRADQQTNEESHSVPIIEEELRVGKREVPKGTVRVEVRTERLEEQLPLTICEDTVSVTRVPIDRAIDAPPTVRTEGDIIVVPVVEEVIIVQRQLVLKEEIHLRRESRSKHVEIPITRRRQRALIQRKAHKKPRT